MIDAIMLARVQFAANITFHIMFPAITIALAWMLLFFKVRYDITKDFKWMEIYRFWVKVFALSFALGVVSGVTMSFQFGTNWPGFMKTVGNIAGPLLAYEVLTAFFMEATFLSVMLFGFNKVSNRVHTTATVLVALGTTFSAFWIIALNSWMHTPVGFEMVEGKAYATDWLAILFNPSMPYRLTHTLLASGLTASFLVAGVSAYKWLLGNRGPAVLSALKTGVYVAAALIPLQIFSGDLHGLNTLEYQPAKIAAMEGIWETKRGADLLLFAWPDQETKTNRFAFGIPKGASLILKHDRNAEIQGINEFKGKHPPVAPLFWSFRIMVGVGILMLGISWFSTWRLRANNFSQKWLARLLVLMTFSGWVATIAGWYTTEIGRQPYLVYGVLRTIDAVSSVGGGTIATTLVTYLALYAALIITYVYVVFFMARSMYGVKK